MWGGGCPLKNNARYPKPQEPPVPRQRACWRTHRHMRKQAKILCQKAANSSPLSRNSPITPLTDCGLAWFQFTQREACSQFNLAVDSWRKLLANSSQAVVSLFWSEEAFVLASVQLPSLLTTYVRPVLTDIVIGRNQPHTHAQTEPVYCFNVCGATFHDDLWNH